MSISTKLDVDHVANHVDNHHVDVHHVDVHLVQVHYINIHHDEVDNIQVHDVDFDHVDVHLGDIDQYDLQIIGMIIFCNVCKYFFLSFAKIFLDNNFCKLSFQIIFLQNVILDQFYYPYNNLLQCLQIILLSFETILGGLLNILPQISIFGHF